MKFKKIFRIKNRFFRLFEKIDEEKMVFLRSFLLSYVVAVLLFFTILIIQCETNITGIYSFARCENVGMFPYCVFTLVQTIVMTTIPFASSIYLLQTDESKHKTIRVIIMILIITLAVLCAIQTTLSKISALWVVTIVMLLAVVLINNFCKMIFSLPNNSARPVKKEESDCKAIT